ncbi:hypothetical protein [Chitinimonas lacunae]|uniref:Uncharacterized protein n=1 Tax=Chitinimonas lacunae TaxID=1963018 RepID=A0ABV8MX29_9NEIS
MQENVIVKFTRAWRHYNPGEYAGFDPLTAKDLVDSTAAEYHKTDDFEEGAAGVAPSTEVLTAAEKPADKSKKPVADKAP